MQQQAFPTMASTTNDTDHYDHNKIVHFASTVEIEFFDANQCSSKVKKNELWYSHVELDIFRSWAERCVQKVRTASQQSQGLLDAADIIGLERHLSFNLNTEFKLRHKAVVTSVLDEQRRQRILRTSNHERLARKCQENSRWARENARAAGLFLERDLDDDDHHDELFVDVRGMHNMLKRIPPIPTLKSVFVEQPSPKRFKRTCCTNNSEVALECALPSIQA